MIHYDLLTQGYLWVGQSDGSVKNSRPAFELVNLLGEYGFGLNYIHYLQLEACPLPQLTAIYKELGQKLKEVFPSQNPILYKEFPDIPEGRNWLNDFRNMYQIGAVTPDPNQRPVFAGTKEVTLLEPVNTDKVIEIYLEKVYGSVSLTSNQKEAVLDIVDLLEVDFSKITFKETKAFLSVDSWKAGKLSVTKADDILRLWLEVSGTTYVDAKAKAPIGKRTWRFVEPSKEMKVQLRAALDRAYDIEESLKKDARLWTRALWYLQPGLYPEYKTLHDKAFALRGATRKNREVKGINDFYPHRGGKTLKTYASRVTEMLNKKDPEVFTLLKKNKGYFMRSLKNLINIYGEVAMVKWLELNPTLQQAAEMYNNFEGFKSSTGVASKASTTATMTSNYERAAMSEKEAEEYKDMLWEYMVGSPKQYMTKVQFDLELFRQPLKTMNARQGSVGLSGRGEIFTIPEDAKYFLAVCSWGVNTDIDFSGWAIKGDVYKKIGWNGQHSGIFNYSGDMTHGPANEHIHGDLKTFMDFDYVVFEARVYRGDFPLHTKKSVFGMEFNKEPVTAFRKDNLSFTVVPMSDARSAFFAAWSKKNQSIVVLDTAIASGSISDESEIGELLPLIDRLSMKAVTAKEANERPKIISLGHYYVLSSLGYEEGGFLIS